MNFNPPALRSTSSRVQICLTAVLLCTPMLSTYAQAAGTASEQANVEVMIRQLNALEAVAQRSVDLPQDPAQRYHLDYPRLASDIARIRQGLQDYLSPSRAQPRDPVEISGQYNVSGDHTP
ncbi:RAQPRD family integrative conjugative element protein [Pseudomonas syringae]|uniref:RAQPRD family integrative conjugative element protein n=2 Tax=Pseudomonas syringae TaxID=317 RepID=A0AA43IT57_PSESX|nr:RAQPRD family integrative conjugative element protein [Pseudomonas syringae]MDH4605285.1 RAQPRD family integrative conjugative element protein [Pseudomonas syringae pv. papulans]MDH4620956.1 RAQPRD family integrative conjugative element protein [Pseudomonas syringae pv. papulans]